MESTILLAFAFASASACFAAKPDVRAAHNLASEFAAQVDPTVTCTAEVTAAAATLDSSLCRAGGIVFRCTAGINAKPVCDLVVDTRPHPPTPPVANPPTAPAPQPPTAPPPKK